MASIDPAVSAVLDRNRAVGAEEDEDELIAALEQDDSSLAAFREQRLQQLHGEFSRAKDMRNSDHGTYTEIKDEKKLMDITTSTKLCVVHFMKPDFTRCRVMDQKLEALAPKHFDTRFLNINVENAPFLVARLKIQVLPCVICFINGVGTDRIIGFEGIGYKPDSFTLAQLEDRLLQAGVLIRAKVVDEDERLQRQRDKTNEQDSDSGDDWD
ncbi:thioredoxin-like protein [Delphinella strobiligena]|nr:thioredoxin-like protein [Delphinella strobiligena]